ncbi:MAG: Asp-tRNA(Asn)/Glu-tRNA(Gln) amidotransferase subunit GatA [Opitutales bacterium]|nr:Asp-tRNA(Asn)/Glu-tRNA(Gln) amidotransferase subunit GatA [Opitutales bacterium]
MSRPAHFPAVRELAASMASGECTSVQLVEDCLARVRDVDPGVGAFLSVDAEKALEAARASDERRARGAVLGPFDGIPVGMKDVIAVKGEPLTCASRMLENFTVPYDAHVTERLRAGGLIPFGRLNMDEFAMGSSTENSALGTTRNPVSADHTPGGSSGGSAAAVAARMVPWALGSDTGGSIRQPASFCGIVGLKPTYGRVSRYGLVAYASSLDQIGPMANSVEDAACLLDAIAGPDERDSTSWREAPPAFAEAAARGPERPLRVGLPKEYFGKGLGAEVEAAVRGAVDTLAAQGCEVSEISLPHTEYAVPVYYIIATAEASSNLARYDGVRYGHRAKEAADGIDLYFRSRGEGFGSEVKRRIILGTYVLSSGYYDAYYLRAQKVRTRIREDFVKAFESVDVLLTPTAPTPPFRRGEKTGDPLSMYLADIYTISANLAGLPCMSVPCGLTEAGLPVGLQLIAPHFAETTLLQAARLYEGSRLS